MTDDDRYVDLEGCYNFRDLGGYAGRDGRRMRRGLLYRSDALHHLTAADVERLRGELGLRLIIDVRSAHEVTTENSSPLATHPVRYEHLPLFGNQTMREEDAPDDLGDLYYMMMRYAREPIASVIEQIAASEDPLVFHCAAGKDRTGVISALLLSLLGVSEADVVEDYVSTSRNLDQIVARLRASESYSSIFTELPPETLHAEARTMEGLLERIAWEFGSMQGYAEWSGIGEKTTAQLETRLLERT
jgi:protein tyrosine/serine phosphatase